MNSTQTTVTKAELQELAKILLALQGLPQVERNAIQHYMKGIIQGIQMAEETTKVAVGT